MADPNEDVGLLGGSFNPVHKGHVSITRSFLKSGYISQLWILLTADPPHKKSLPTLSFELRLKMLERAFSSEKNVHISTVEQNLPKPSYTVRTLRYLYNQYPKKRFWLCMGEDSVVNFKKWYKWEEILQYCELLVAQRPSVDSIEIDEDLAAKTHFITHQPVEVSSTDIRNQIKNKNDVSELIPEEVEKVIREHKLYQD